ncbi:4-O-methyl-glucuronoyl methylesterase [Madurella mycetomatis]|uniref:(4-O-methyl)-D-glucuronate--lignin esterase n=1 Tax=Madurella mycetomatis TaxID=100816 RepID=A0A175VXF0_9PEZI|nr:4-O-methyl-glucuronoyl methylesterase [Madurella mycetomatis]
MKLTAVLTSVFALAGGQSIATPCPLVPANFSLSPPQRPGSRGLPDPFLTIKGTRITKKSEWRCRRSELAQLAETYEFGPIPGPPTSLNASVSNDGKQLILTITVDDKTVTFPANITYPTTGAPPYPALILIQGANIPIPSNIATITLPINTLAIPYGGSFVGQGLFYQLYGPQHEAGITAVGIWGVSRIIDAIELTAGQTSLDPTRLGVTGCSRNGRTALAVGGFEERVALTIVQEAGEGGDSCYRLRNDDKGAIDICNTVQCPADDTGYGQRASFKRFSNNPHELPFDRHSVAALVAPRALLVLQDDIQYTQPSSSFQCMGATKKVYEALGLGDRMAVSLQGGHNLCQFPAAQQRLLNAYIRKFLVKEEGVDFDTDVIELNSSLRSLQNIRKAYDWTTPTLE